MIVPAPRHRPAAPGAVAGEVFTDGPWLQAFYVEVPGRVSSKSNARRYTRSPRERAAAKRQSAYHTTVHTIVQARRPANWELGPPPPAPVADRPAIAAACVATTTVDATNVPKTLLDACEGLVFHTDAAVRAATQVTVRSSVGQRLLLGFARHDPDAGPEELAASLAELTARLTARF